MFIKNAYIVPLQAPDELKSPSLPLKRDWTHMIEKKLENTIPRSIHLAMSI